MAPNIYWVGGGKGGVGKSMISMALLDYLLDKGVPALFMESDTSNPDVYKSYRTTLPSELVDLDDVDGWIQVVNSCDANRDKAVVVNTPARSATGVAKFGGTMGSSLTELKRSLVGLWAINRYRDSVELLKDFMDAMPSCRVHALRKLYFGDESKFELYAASKALRPRVESGGGKSLNFLDLADRVADDLYKDRLTIVGAVEKAPLGNRAELRRWRSAVAQMLAEVVDG